MGPGGGPMGGLGPIILINTSGGGILPAISGGRAPRILAISSPIGILGCPFAPPGPFGAMRGIIPMGGGTPMGSIGTTVPFSVASLSSDVVASCAKHSKVGKISLMKSAIFGFLSFPPWPSKVKSLRKILVNMDPSLSRTLMYECVRNGFKSIRIFFIKVGMRHSC